jgi:hypothetical protein
VTVPTWPEDPGWRVRAGAGLLIHSPMSDERREAQRREDEREAQQAEFEAELAKQAALERRWELQRQGVQPRTVAEVLAAAGAAADRADRREERLVAAGLEEQGKPKPKLTETAELIQVQKDVFEKGRLLRKLKRGRR